MTKIVLSSDYHLKFSSPFDRTTSNGIPSRLQEVIDSISWVISTGKQHKASYFISLGDTFDSSEKLLTKESLAIKGLFTKLAQEFNKTSMFLVGNHDQISSDSNILDLFTPTIRVFNSMSVVDVSGARLFFLPYLRESEDFYKALVKFKEFDCPGKKYLFSHFWDSSIMSVDSEAIDLSKIDCSFFTRIFSGHYHTPTTDAQNKLTYVGTLLNKSFRETGKKGCWILDTTSDSLKFIENPLSPEFYQCVDSNILANLESLNENAYYRVACDPENVLEVSKLLSRVKGFELISKQDSSDTDANISIFKVEKKNSSSLKEYILENASLYLPEGVSEEVFKQRGQTFLAGL